MGEFCPLLKENCKHESCVFWQEKCLFVLFFQNCIAKPNVEVYEGAEEEEEEIVIPDEVKNFSAEQLAELAFSYAQKEVREEEQKYLFSDFFDEFWNSIGLEDKYDLSNDMRAKIDKAEKITEKKWEKKIADSGRAKFQKEKESLPQLIQDCTKWAKQNGLKRVTQSDISTFLLEKNIDILRETKTMLYSKTNALLKG